MNIFLPELDPVLALLLRLGLASLFFAAALHKARDLHGFADTISDYQIFAARFSAWGARGLAALELVCGLCLLLPSIDPLGSLIALGLFALYSGAIGINLLRGRRQIDCGCMGFGSRQTLSGWLLVRNALLALLALMALAPASARPLGWIDFITLAFGLGLTALVWLASHQLAAASRASAAWGESQ
jgi:hypothetical protein